METKITMEKPTSHLHGIIDGFPQKGYKVTLFLVLQVGILCREVGKQFTSMIFCMKAYLCGEILALPPNCSHNRSNHHI